MVQQHIQGASQHVTKAHQENETHQEEEIQRRQLRVCFFILVSFWTLAAITLPVVAFCLTKNPLCFTFISTLLPPTYLWCRFAKYLLPMDDKWLELEKLKRQARMQHATDKQQKKFH